VDNAFDDAHYCASYFLKFDELYISIEQKTILVFYGSLFNTFFLSSEHFVSYDLKKETYLST